MRRLRIAHVTATFPPYLAGTGNVALHNARSLARLGHAVAVYTADLGARSDDRNEEYRVRRLRPLLRIGNAPLLPGLLRLGRYDLVHLHYPFIFGAEMIWLLGALKGQPYVITYHNDLRSPGVKGALFGLYDRAWGGRVVRGARKVFVPSADSAPTSRLLGPLVRSDPERIQEVPNGVDIDVFRTDADGAAVRDRLGIGRDDDVVVFVGRMDSAHHANSGVPILLEVIAGMRDRRPTLILVGGGDRVAEYTALAESLGVGDRTRFVGSVPHDQLSPYLVAADVAVQPSLGQETFGIAALEAMACGRPVVASDLPGARRVVADAGGGLLVRPGDAVDLAHAIDRLLSDAPLRDRLATAGRASVAARFDWDRIALTLERAYEEVLSTC